MGSSALWCLGSFGRRRHGDDVEHARADTFGRGLHRATLAGAAVSAAGAASPDPAKAVVVS
jgi:hypothetical protein